MKERKIVNGVTTPSDAPLTRNERQWIEFLRIISRDSDPAFSASACQMLQLFFENEESAQNLTCNAP
jgi:hypothetical protein